LRFANGSGELSPMRRRRAKSDTKSLEKADNESEKTNLYLLTSRALSATLRLADSICTKPAEPQFSGTRLKSG
jgi:hypothetical protein